MQQQILSRVGWWMWAVGLGVALIALPGCPGTPPDDGGGSTTEDADGDGVVNAEDTCPDTPSGASVDAAGCAASQLDSDDDGVTDDLDACADTPSGEAVDATGCPVDPGAGAGDADSDGVRNDQDDCPNTPAGEDVDANGCAAAQRDSDGDGVNDAIDECADTPSTVNIDAVGCPVSVPGTPDDDEDGVPNDIDQCDATATGAAVDANGCAAAQRDHDGDGVIDDLDECPETPEGATTVNAVGCAATERDTDGDGVSDADDDCPGTRGGVTVDSVGCPTTAPPPPPPPPPGDGECGDGTVDSGEECDDGNRVGGDGCRADCTTEECGDGIVDPREECDPPNGETCDATCAFISGGTIAADNCADATMLTGQGAFDFDNSAATLDGPGHTACVQFELDQIELDMWGCWTAPCTATAFIETCGLTAVDTKMAVYAGCDCPVTNANLLDCNDDRCETQSLVSFAATAGQQYLVRVGSYPDDPPVGGPGAVSIHCGIDVCPAEGECTAANGSPGCSDQGCCETVCAADAYCCESEWDALCAQEAVGFCGTGFAACGRGAGSCSEANGSAGCDDVDCCNAVCQEDSFCCVSDWDDLCAAAEPTTCFSSCTASAGACTGVHAIPGCEDASCCAEVCPRDSFCCEFEWDAGCVELANEFCTP